MVEQLTDNEQRWLIAEDMLNCFIAYLKGGQSREEWMLLATLLTVQASTLNPYSFERLRTAMEKFAEEELSILQAPNN